MDRAVSQLGATLVALGLCAACTSSGAGAPAKSYRTITCAEYVKLASAPDALSMDNGSLNMANDFLASTPIDPKGGADDVAAFGDQIVASCDTATGDTPIVQLRGRIVSVFLAQHPQDRA